jgi:hypothetical protein
MIGPGGERKRGAMSWGRGGSWVLSEVWSGCLVVCGAFRAWGHEGPVLHLRRMNPFLICWLA